MASNTTNNNAIMTAEKLEYGECAPKGKSLNARIRVSALPGSLRASALKLDEDGDGALNSAEIVSAIRNLSSQEKENRNLKKIICAFAFVTILLVGSIFGASIASARLSKEFVVDPVTGFAMTNGGDQILKTELAIEREINFSPVTMTNDELRRVQDFALSDGDVRFLVHGFARDTLQDHVIINVEGGTIKFDEDGIVSATGDAMILLVAAGVLETGTGRRNLGTSCSVDWGILR